MHFDPGAANRAMRLTREHVESGRPGAPTIAETTESRRQRTKTEIPKWKPIGIWFRIVRVLRPAR